MKKKLVRVSQYIKIRSIKTVGLALFSSLILAPSLYAQISLDVQDQSIRHILKEIETISRMMGHTNIKTTQIYAKITKEKISQDMEALSHKLKGLEMQIIERM